MADRPNVLVVVLDTARADHLPPHDGRLAPFLANAAESGEALGRAYAAAPWTLPSHGTLFSGAYPTESGIHGRGRQGAARARALRAAIRAQGERWLPEALRHGGYRTWAVSANPWIAPYFGFDYGFDRFEVVGNAVLDRSPSAPRRPSRTSGRVRSRLASAGRFVVDTWGRRDAGGRAALKHVAELAAGDGPFFGIVNLMEAHVPYVPPRGYREYRRRRWWRALRAAQKRRSFRNMLAYNLGRDVLTEEELELLRGMYRGEIRYLDALVRRIFGVLPAGTITVVTSDHGEALGERHTVDHQLTVREEVIRVPFIVLGAPGHPGLTGLRELPELVAGWTGLDPSPWRERSRVPPGVAVVEYESAWLGERRLEKYVASLKLSEAAVARLRAPMAAVVEGDRKLIVEGEHRRLVDPADESVVLADPQVAARLGGFLGAAQSVRAPDLDEPDEQDVRAIEERLERLGYL